MASPAPSDAKYLGSFELLRELGRGGMGIVHLARDTKLDREVAIKVLPELFARDPERLARFEREAKLLATLNHPNVAAIYGLEESHGQRFLVLEMVPGETLRERLRRGPLPVEEALGVARQIAEALEAAHENGVVHRDLKPGNVKVTPEGKVKVLDFGLAKAFADQPASTDPAHSPTLTADYTGEGVVLGTAAYMSPEQARGKPLDKRTDIWSFGCVLYEMLTGKQAFGGETTSDVMAGILRGEPDWRALPGETPPTVQLLLRRCLHKDPNHRLHAMADARIEIEETLADPSSSSLRLAAAAVAPRSARRGLVLLWGLSCLSVGAVAAGLAVWKLKPLPTGSPMRLAVTLPPTTPLLGYRDLALSPDGRRLAYSAKHEDSSLLYLREMDRREAIPIAGTEGGQTPFFSPDGEWLGFFADNKLKKVSVRGTPALTLCDAPYSFGACWGTDDMIVFAPRWSAGLSRVAAGGGTPEILTTPDPQKGELNHLWPEVLPGAQAVLFSCWSGGSFDEARIELLTLDTGERRTLIEGGTYPKYARSGHLVYVRAGAVLAAPFDLTRLELTGPSVQILQGVRMYATIGEAGLAVSSTGLLAYAADDPVSRGALVWVTREGQARPLKEAGRRLGFPRLSPDGRQLAVTVIEKGSPDVWIYGIPRSTFTRLTFEGSSSLPVWTPDGRRMVFASNRAGQWNLFWKPADGSGQAEPLLTSEHLQFPMSWSPDGRVLAFVDLDPATGWDLWMLPLEDQRRPRPFLQTPFAETQPMFSPDGKWVAYTSNESGREEVYVRPYPGPGGKRQISSEGGLKPLWSPDGKELFYRQGDKMMAVAVSTEPDFSAATPKLLFEAQYRSGGNVYPPDYDITPDGERFVMIKTEEVSAPTQINVVVNWFEELKRRVPAARN